MKIVKSVNFFMITIMLVLSLAGCSSKSTGQATGDYNSADVGKVNKVVQGVIVSGRTVNVYNKPVSSKKSKPDEIDTDTTRKTGYEYVIKLDSGAIISVVQTENLELEAGQRILVIYGAQTRVVPDEGTD